MKCPHCNVAIHEGFSNGRIAETQEILKNGRLVAPSVMWFWAHQRCPECYERIIRLESLVLPEGSRESQGSFMVYPRTPSRQVPAEVVDPYRQDFVEACTVLPYSPKASAALSRRCLQAVLRDKAGTTKKDLYDQIEEVISSRRVPSHIADDLHAVRNIGNFAAHLMKSTSTGSIVDVEPGEAEWNLDVLESLFDFYFVQPALSAKRKAELNKKLKDAGKPEMK